MNILLSLLFSIILTAPATLNASAFTERKPYVMNVSPTEITLIWRTLLPGRDMIRFGRLTGSESFVWEVGFNFDHEVQIRDLEPGTCYQYRVIHWGESWHRSGFCTASLPIKPYVHFLALGDSGEGSPAQYKVAENIRAMHPDLILHVGDVVYPAGEENNYDANFFSPYTRIIDHIPMFLTLGNHDIKTKNGEAYFDAFDLPKNNPLLSEAFYSFRWGHVLFITIDSNAFVNGTPEAAIQLDWLRDQLMQNRLPWVVVFFHHPVYASRGNHGSTPEMQKALLPLFEKYHVQLVLSGHDHHYERTKLLNGTLYIVTGGGGGGVRPVRPNPSFSEVAISTHHHVSINIYEDLFALTAIDENGQIIDHVSYSLEAFKKSWEEPPAPNPLRNRRYRDYRPFP